METSKPVEINVVGEETGRTWKGEFTFRGTLTRRQRMYADQVRRTVLGPSPEGQQALGSINTEAFIIGQLAVMVADAPKWWQESDSGLDLEDWNVVLSVYEAGLKVQDGVNADLKKDSEKVAKKLKDKKVDAPVAGDDDDK